MLERGSLRQPVVNGPGGDRLRRPTRLDLGMRLPHVVAAPARLSARDRPRWARCETIRIDRRPDLL